MYLQKSTKILGVQLNEFSKSEQHTWATSTRIMRQNLQGTQDPLTSVPVTVTDPTPRWPQSDFEHQWLVRPDLNVMWPRMGSCSLYSFLLGFLYSAHLWDSPTWLWRQQSVPFWVVQWPRCVHGVNRPRCLSLLLLGALCCSQYGAKWLSGWL